ncbi:MAG: hypothetical protein H6R14_1901 [Proteobacteria bacterium]|nr:hypothetical protein [Pseudomonadota bacterium]
MQCLAGPVRFELTMGFPTPVFKTGAFNRSATDPEGAHDITVTTGTIRYKSAQESLKLHPSSVSLSHCRNNTKEFPA